MADEGFDELRRGLRGDDDATTSFPRVRLVRVVAGAGAAVALALAVIVATAARPAGEPPESSLERAPTTIVVDGSPATPTTSPAAKVWPAEPVEVAGNEVRVGGHRWRVGDVGDIVAVGDWDCDGTDTPAVLRPRTGRLHLFDTWAADATTAITAAPGPSVPIGATAMEPSGCGLAKVRTADGRAVDVTTTAVGQ